MYYNDWCFGLKGKRYLEVADNGSLCNGCIMIAFIISAKKLKTFLDFGSFLKFNVLRQVLGSLMQ